MCAQEYLTKMKNIQEKFLGFLDSDASIEDNLHEFTDFLKNQSIQDQYLIEFLHLISNISKNHCRKHSLILKIENILAFLKDIIIQHVTSQRLFNIFKNNKRILLFLFEEQFITIDDYIFSSLKMETDLVCYFKPELVSYITNKPKKIDPSFAESRREGENQDYICKLIRTDSVKEFDIYVTKSNLSLSQNKIKPSIFETNQYLMGSDVSLIKYSAFHGSIQIFKYLLQNKVQLDSHLWNYAIHSNNQEMIHILEESDIKVYDFEYENFYEHSISCYNHEIAKYIKDNLIKKLKEDQKYLLQYHNYDFLPNDINDKSLFPHLCKYDYLKLASIMINDINANELNIIFFFNFF